MFSKWLARYQYLNTTALLILYLLLRQNVMATEMQYNIASTPVSLLVFESITIHHCHLKVELAGCCLQL